MSKFKSLRRRIKAIAEPLSATKDFLCSQSHQLLAARVGLASGNAHGHCQHLGQGQKTHEKIIGFQIDILSP